MFNQSQVLAVYSQSVLEKPRHLISDYNFGDSEQIVKIRHVQQLTEARLHVCVRIERSKQLLRILGW